MSQAQDGGLPGTGGMCPRLAFLPHVIKTLPAPRPAQLPGGGRNRHQVLVNSTVLHRPTAAARSTQSGRAGAEPLCQGILTGAALQGWGVGWGAWVDPVGSAAERCWCSEREFTDLPPPSAAMLAALEDKGLREETLMAWSRIVLTYAATDWTFYLEEPLNALNEGLSFWGFVFPVDRAPDIPLVHFIEMFITVGVGDVLRRV